MGEEDNMMFLHLFSFVSTHFISWKLHAFIIHTWLMESVLVCVKQRGQSLSHTLSITYIVAVRDAVYEKTSKKTHTKTQNEAASKSKRRISYLTLSGQSSNSQHMAQLCRTAAQKLLLCQLLLRTTHTRPQKRTHITLLYSRKACSPV